MVKIYDTDTVHEMARKIYYFFDVNASVSIKGFVKIEERMKLIPKGEAVIEQLKLFDEIDNIREKMNTRGIKKQRDYVYPSNSIGGPNVQKQFRYESRIRDGEPFITIWRTQ